MTEPCQRDGRRGAMPLKSLNADDIDCSFLAVARLFFVAFSEREPGALISTMLGAKMFFPTGDSAETLRLAYAVVHEMRSSRRTCFQFSNPLCPCCAEIVTADERHLLQLVQHARAGRVSNVMSSAMLLCEGNPINRVTSAAFAFADKADEKTKAPVH